MKVKELIEMLKNLNQDDIEVSVLHFGRVVTVEPADEHNEVIIVTDAEENEK